MKPYTKLLFALPFITCLIFSSCGLRMDEAKLDPYSGELTEETQGRRLGVTQGSWNTLSFVNGFISIKGINRYELHMVIYAKPGEYNQYSMSDKQQLLLQTSDQREIYFTNEKSISSDLRWGNQSGNRLQYWYLETVYLMSTQQLKQLASSTFVASRFETSTGNIDFYITQSQSKDLNGLAKLALKAGGDLK